MGNRLATIDMGRKLGAVPLWRGISVPIYHNVAWAEAYLHTKWYPDASSHLATIDMGRKLGAVPLLGELGPHLTQCHLGHAVRPTSVPSGILMHPAVWPQ